MNSEMVLAAVLLAQTAVNIWLVRMILRPSPENHVRQPPQSSLVSKVFARPRWSKPEKRQPVVNDDATLVQREIDAREGGGWVR